MIKKKLSHHCRAALLSLFVMLTIPSVSSGIFGNGDAEAACIEKSSYIGTSFDFTSKMAENPAFCGKADAVCSGSFIVSSTNLCISDATASSGDPKCAAKTQKIRCSNLNNSQCGTGIGDIGSHCKLVAEDTDNNKLVDAVCRVYQIATGTAGKAFAAVGVISVGIGFFTGKVSWGLMISVAAGIAVFFGAPSIISVISGSDASNLCSNVGSTN